MEAGFHSAKEDGKSVTVESEPEEIPEPLSSWRLLDLIMITTVSGFFAFRNVKRKPFTRNFYEMKGAGCLWLIISRPVLMTMELLLAIFIAAWLAENADRFSGTDWSEFGETLIIAPFLGIGTLLYHLQKRDFKEWISFFLFMVSLMLTFNYVNLMA